MTKCPLRDVFNCPQTQVHHSHVTWSPVKEAASPSEGEGSSQLSSPGRSFGDGWEERIGPKLILKSLTGVVVAHIIMGKNREHWVFGRGRIAVKVLNYSPAEHRSTWPPGIQPPFWASTLLGAIGQVQYSKHQGETEPHGHLSRVPGSCLV